MNKYEKIKNLVQLLNNWTKLYDEGCPVVDDEEWDNKYFELKDLEQETGLILSNSPTQSISYEIVNVLSKVEHSHKMLSLEKTKSVEEVSAFVGKKDFLVMCKMDGLTCSLTYRNGELVSAETRGNGIIGEDILHNAKVLPSIPKKIPYMEELVIDGEIICTYKDFEQFSSEYKNPRNFAAGSIRLLDSNECATRNLTFVAWDVITQMMFNDGTEYKLNQKLNYLIQFGFTVVPYTSGPAHYVDNTPVEMDMFITQVMEKAKMYGYPIDGLVFKFNDCAYGRCLGETAHHFKNALAYKFYDETYESTLLDIEWSLGRTGVLTPVAIFEPIDIDGSTVERASLHNISVLREILDKPYVGQKIEIFKANMIIPQIKSAIKSITNSEKYLEIPNTCVVCGGLAEQCATIDSVVLQCMNPSCEGKLINKLVHFCDKKGLDIKGLSCATLEKLVDWGWVNDYNDLFNLSKYREEWIKKTGFGVKSVDKILNTIEASTTCGLANFISALGIPLIGATASAELEKHFKTWDNFIEAVENNFAFSEIPNFGIEMDNKIRAFDYTIAKFLVENYIHFTTIDDNATSSSGQDLTGKNFVITGKLHNFKNRDEIKKKIESLGGKVVGSVSKNTHYLINNDITSNSSKNVTAKSLNIPILSEQDFIEMFDICD